MDDTTGMRPPGGPEGSDPGDVVDPEVSSARKRSNLTGRAAMLAVVVCMLAISLAYPLREYLDQRGDIGELRARVAEQKERVGELEKAKARWQDKTYVEAQARERLRYVMPGEIVYVVLEADQAPAPDGVVTKAPEDAQRSPWFGDLWHSVEVAGRG
jgi:cell division protein FtsB